MHTSDLSTMSGEPCTLILVIGRYNIKRFKHIDLDDWPQMARIQSVETVRLLEVGSDVQSSGDMLIIFRCGKAVGELEAEEVCFVDSGVGVGERTCSRVCDNS